MRSAIDQLEARLSARLRRRKDRQSPHKVASWPSFPAMMSGESEDGETFDAAYVLNFDRAFVPSSVQR